MAADVRINGKPLPEPLLVVEVTVDDCADRPSMFSFTIQGWDAESKNIPHERWFEDPLFSIGNEVKIRMEKLVGTNNPQLTLMIVGDITALEPEFIASWNPRLIVRGYDRRHRLQQKRRTRTFLNTKDSIIVQIARGAGLEVYAQDSKVILDYILQDDQTDWEFLSQRARLIGYQMGVTGTRLYFNPLDALPPPNLTLEFESGLLEFRPTLSSAGQADEVEVRSWNLNKEVLKGESSAASMIEGREKIKEGEFASIKDELLDFPVATLGEADQIAAARMNEIKMGSITGTGVCQDEIDIRAGTNIRITKVGRLFGGAYYVKSATHTFSNIAPPSGTRFTVRRAAR